MREDARQEEREDERDGERKEKGGTRDGGVREGHAREMRVVVRNEQARRRGANGAEERQEGEGATLCRPCMRGTEMMHFTCILRLLLPWHRAAPHRTHPSTTYSIGHGGPKQTASTKKHEQVAAKPAPKCKWRLARPRPGPWFHGRLYGTPAVSARVKAHTHTLHQQEPGDVAVRQPAVVPATGTPSKADGCCSPAAAVAPATASFTLASTRTSPRLSPHRAVPIDCPDYSPILHRSASCRRPVYRDASSSASYTNSAASVYLSVRLPSKHDIAPPWPPTRAGWWWWGASAKLCSSTSASEPKACHSLTIVSAPRVAILSCQDRLCCSASNSTLWHNPSGTCLALWHAHLQTKHTTMQPQLALQRHLLHDMSTPAPA